MKVRCPHCHNPIELLQESATLDSDIECPSCGSSFNLLRETDTASYEPAKRENVAHFELIEKLGTGAFGTVWKARDTQLDRIVALKIPRKSQLDEEETEKFLREARASAQLRHPNIVSVHEVGRDGPTVYIAADLIEGLTLSDWLTGQRLTPREAAELCVKLADAVHHAHECGVIHRDLKPSNVMLNAAGEPFVMDFGLAKREAGEITMTVDGQIIGTPAYMAPEQARGESHHVDRRSDVYSLGVLLFELLTGERPFRGNARMLLYQVINDEPPSPRRLNAAIPKDLETICLKCLEKDRAKRFATAHDLANELRRYLRGEPILSRPVSQAERLWRWSKRNPVVATLSASIAALILFLLVAGPIVYFREKGLRLEAQNAATDAVLSLKDANRSRGEAKQAQATAEQETVRAKLSEELANRNAGLANDAAAREQQRVKELEIEKQRLEIAVQLGFKFARGLETGKYANADQAYADIFETGVQLPDDERAGMQACFLALVELMELWRYEREARAKTEAVDADLSFQRIAENAGKAIKLGVAMAQLESAINRFDRLGIAWLLRGVVRMELGIAPSEVLSDFDRAVALLPNSSLAHTLRGACHRNLGDNDKAGQDFLRALELDQHNGAAHLLMGMMLYYMDRNGDLIDQAIEHLDRFDVGSTKGYWFLGFKPSFSWSAEARRVRCQERLLRGDYEGSLSDAITGVQLAEATGRARHWSNLIAALRRLPPATGESTVAAIGNLMLREESASARFALKTCNILAHLRFRKETKIALSELLAQLDESSSLVTEVDWDFCTSIDRWSDSEATELELRDALGVLVQYLRQARLRLLQSRLSDNAANLARKPTDTQLLRDVSNLHLQTGRVQRELHDTLAALDSFRSAQRVATQHAVIKPSDEDAHAMVTICRLHLGRTHVEAFAYDDAIDELSDAMSKISVKLSQQRRNGLETALKTELEQCRTAKRAVGDWDSVHKTPIDQLPKLLLLRCQEFARQGRLSDAAETAEKLRRLQPQGSDNLYFSARAYGLCATAARNPRETKRQVDQAVRKKSIESALDCLRESVKLGKRQSAEIRNESDLVPLQELPEFQAILQSTAE